MDAERTAEFLQHPADEDAARAVDRYHAFLAVAFAGAPKEAMAPWRLRFSQPVAIADIRAAEQRLKIKLPPSYVELITGRGLFSGPGEHLVMLEPDDLGTLLDHLLQTVYAVESAEELAEELGLDSSELRRLEKAIVFSTGQYEELLDVFLLDAVDSVTGEAPIACFDPQEGMSAVLSLVRNRQETSGREIDRHVRELVDFNIHEVAKRLRANDR
ncbi:MAG TPA: hypothetical protein VLB44_11330 [Kofleriaceae bacterium]|nr:hypothetical protein [Kofleriaceae bacterium]